MSSAHAFKDEERPLFVGSPYSPAHPQRRRIAYFAIGAFLSATSSLGNALTTVNTTYIAGELGIFAAQAAALPAVYVAMNATANLTLVKARTQFGIPQVTIFLLLLYVLAGTIQLFFPSFAASIASRAVNGMQTAAMVTLGFYYLMQALPPKIKPLGLIVGMGLGQMATPFARLVPVDVVTMGGLWGLHAIEISVALAALAMILLLPLPQSERAKVFSPLDVVTILLVVSGLMLLCQVIGQGRVLWWLDTPWLGYALAAAIPLLIGAWLIETNRQNPLVHFEWLGTLGILRFVAVAMVIRLALAEQTYGAVGLLTLGGLNNDQLHMLFATVAAAMLLGIIVAALTLSERRMPWQVLIASLIIAAAAWMDSDANVLTRPDQLIWSQALIGFGTTLFVGPALVYGFSQMLRRGGDHLVSFNVAFSISQNVGGLAGSAFLGTMQTIWARNASNALSSELVVGDPQATARIAGGAASLAGAIVDPLQRGAQGAGLLGREIAQHAAAIAYADTYRLVAFIAVGIAIFIFVNIRFEARRRQWEKNQ